MDCIFCKIIAGEIPCAKVYEDESVLAFLDINPVNPGHTLVIPKTHSANFEEIEQEDLMATIKAVKKIGKAIKDGLEIKGYNVNENNDPVAGQDVAHIHFHIIPRHEGDGFKFWPQGQYQEGQAQEVAERIKNKLE